MTDVRYTHTQAMHRGSDGGPLDADDIGIDDAGAYYAGATIEAALQEIGAGGIGGGGGSLTLTPEVPTGTIDGVNDTFTLSVTPDGLILFKNGLVQREGSGNDYTIATNTITYEAGNIPQVGDSHIAYITAAGSAPIDIMDEGGSLTATPTSIDFVGAGVTATTSGDDVTVTIPGGGSGGVTDVYGDGSDGSVTVNSGSFSVSVGGSALITSNTLVRDAYFDDLTINGGDLITAGFKLYISGTLTMTSGVIRCNGGNGGAGGNGTAGAGGAAGATPGGAGAGTTANSAPGSAGAIGGFNANGANPGGAGTASSVGLGTGSNGAAGGASGQGQTGGTGVTAPAGTNTLTERPFDYSHATTYRFHSGVVFTTANVIGTAVGSGSGAGSPASGGGGSGGSGASGGILIVFARTITGTTDIQALGGTGGNGGNGGGTDAGGGGGGSGGNGGFICLIYSDQTGWSGTLDVSGGAGGTGGTGIGTGSAGGNGNTGRVGKAVSFQVNA